MMIRFSIFCMLLLSMGFRPLVAQNEVKPIDGIVAKVNSYIVLKSEVEFAYQSYMAGGERMPPDLKCEIMRQMLLEKVLVAKAELDSIVVAPQEVDLEMTQRMQQMIAEVGGDPKIIEDRFGKTITQLKEELRRQVKEQLVARKMKNEITQDVTVTPAQVREFFENIPKDSVPLLDKEYEVAHILKYPDVSRAEKDKVRAELIAMRKRILEGEDFAKMAAQYSEDLGSAAKGGNLGLRTRGELVPEFEAAIYTLKEGEISMPVESEFGFHIIQLIERRGNEFRSRHILQKPKATEKDIQKTIAQMDSIRRLIVEGQITFGKAAKEFSEDRATSSSGGDIKSRYTGISKVIADELDFQAFKVVDTMQVGNISAPLRFRGRNGEQDAVRLIYFKAAYDAHEPNLEQDYERIYQVVRAEQQNEKIERWFDEAIQELFIDIDPEYDRCNIIGVRK